VTGFVQILGARRSQDFAASKLGGKVGHFKRDVRDSPDKVGNRRVCLEAHPFRAEFAVLVTHDKEFQIFQVSFPRLRFGSENPDVVIGAFFRSPRELAQDSTLFVTAFKSSPGLSIRTLGIKFRVADHSGKLARLGENMESQPVNYSTSVLSSESPTPFNWRKLSTPSQRWAE
jgi:hypothetical protein